MEDQLLTDLPALTSPASGDKIYLVDVSDTTDNAAGSSKYITFSNFVSGITGFAASGANSDITSLSGLTTPLSVAQGGTGAATLTGILFGNGTSAVTALSSSGTGNVVRVTSPSITTPTLTSPVFATNADLNGVELILDADADTSITADTDDQIDYRLGASDRFRMKNTGDFDLVGSSANIQVAGADPKRGIYIGAGMLAPTTTSGCAPVAQNETSTNDYNYKFLAFDASTIEYAFVEIPQAPDYWDLSTITVKFHWTATSGTATQTVIWGAAALALSDDDALDTAVGTAVTVTDALIATGDQHNSDTTTAITVGGTPAKGDALYIRIHRKADDGSDTLAADALLKGITVKFGVSQYNDA